jgi:hypothetical protein
MDSDEFQQDLWNNLWNTWKSPFMVIRKIGFAICPIRQKFLMVNLRFRKFLSSNFIRTLFTVYDVDEEDMFNKEL